jgi:hypothetical protein
MRGVEQPTKVLWTRPFFWDPYNQWIKRQLISHSLILQIVSTIWREEVDQTLSLTENMPLAITLLAPIVYPLK